jgi:hypothetical protein
MEPRAVETRHAMQAGLIGSENIGTAEGFGGQARRLRRRRCGRR